MELKDIIQQKIDNKTKPPGSLGRLEEIALQIGLIQETDSPAISNPAIVIFAADHGISATGLVNPYPQAVTAQMVLNFIRGGAAINVFCRQHQINLQVVDAGVNADFAKDIPQLIHAKIGYGTKNFLETNAMSRQDMQEALTKGKEIVDMLFKQSCNCIGFGEMGIGNTSAASLIMSLLTGFSLTECTGRGTGANDEQLTIKIRTLEQVRGFHFPEPPPAGGYDAETILQKVGGFEIAMMTGAYLRAAELKMIILVDGFIAGAALLLARAMNDRVTDNCIFAHTSGEQGHRKMMDALGARPLLELGLRLGEGTGAAMALPLIRSAVGFLREMASFSEAGVSQR